ncbi:hypothetical protein [Marinobacter zhanjiangensis]|uniref:PilZ domain-containing protein n=1 Tax=Marinobacter zhanjiangensis TaxID=578215 RepID=A0ABQ3ATS6_9GAMM|nr:hypothetical protein [Marinobacter zhanjiangensis]GGY67416.1 hypothetical protein GCM10007071_13020 [Marinobacter zhanjiangensis]
MQMSDNTYHTPLPDLVARFTLRKGLFRKELVEARLFDLNQFGCVLKTDKVFEPGETLGLELEMQMPFENLQASGLTGLITERRKYCSNFFYFVDFITSDYRPKTERSEQLERIREVLDRKKSLLSRRENPSLGVTA